MLIEMEQIRGDIPKVSDLSNRPNYPLPLGGDGLGAAALKARFDALPIAVRDKVNTLLAALASADEGASGAAHVAIVPQTYGEGRTTARSVADLVTALADTGLAQLLMVQVDGNVCSLQECLQTYGAYLSESIVEGTLTKGVFVLTLRDGTAIELPLIPMPQMVTSETLDVVHGERYVLPRVTTLSVRYPTKEVIYEANGRAEAFDSFASETVVFSDKYTAEGLSVCGELPAAGTVCVVRLEDKTFLDPAVAMVGAAGEVLLHTTQMDITLTKTDNGVKIVAYEHAGGRTEGEALLIHISMYLPFVADMRICMDENGGTTSFPPSLYHGIAPDFAAGTIWDLHLDGGVIEARRVTTAAEADAELIARLEKILEVVANGAY